MAITLSTSTLKKGGTAAVTFTFAEAVTGFTASDVVAPGGYITGLTSVDGATWTATFTASGSNQGRHANGNGYGNTTYDGSTPVAMTVAAGAVTLVSTGAASTSTETSGSYTVDATAPSVKITLADPILKAGESSAVTFVFSEAVSGFDVADITASQGVVSALTSTDNITWSANFEATASAANGFYNLTVVGTGLADAVGNTGKTERATYKIDSTVDTTAPAALDVYGGGNGNNHGNGYYLGRGKGYSKGHHDKFGGTSGSIESSTAWKLATASGEVVDKDNLIQVRGLEFGAKWFYSTDSGSTWTEGTGNSFTLNSGTYAANQVQVKQVDNAGNTGAITQNANTLSVASSMIAVDLDKSGSISYSSIQTDLSGDGKAESTAWVGAADGILVWDKDASGSINSATELHFSQHGGRNDIEGAKVALDSNCDNVVSSADTAYSQLYVWNDANQNGVSDAGELKNLASLGIQSLSLRGDNVQTAVSADVTEISHSSAVLSDSTSMKMADVILDNKVL